MKAFVKRTKTNIYVNFNGKLFFKQKGYYLKEMTKEAREIKTAWKEEFGWEEFDANSPENALQQSYDKRRKERDVRKKEVEAWRSKKLGEINSKWDKLLQLETIPANIDNIKTVLEILNMQNWGGWKLPKMSIGYIANQYDCDGKIATTMKFDIPIEGNRMFKVGGKIGHLEKYLSL